ncbi:PIPO, partial [Brugmansia mosaic virus]
LSRSLAGTVARFNLARKIICRLACKKAKELASKAATGSQNCRFERNICFLTKTVCGRSHTTYSKHYQKGKRESMAVHR